MNAYKRFYLFYYFLVREDKKLSRTARIKFLIELVFSMLCASLLFLIVGFLNIRTDNFVAMVVLLSIVWLLSRFISRLYFIKLGEEMQIKSTKPYNLNTKRIYAVLGLTIIFGSFLVMILSAIGMSYLWSLELF